MKKIELWRIVVGGLSILFILYMWMKKGMGSIDMSLPLMVTSLAVTCLKVGLIGIAVLLIKFVITKIKR